VVHWYLDRTAKEIARLKEVEDADAAMAAPDLAGDNIEVQSSSDVSEEDQFAGTLRELQEPLLTISYKLMHCFTPKMMAEAVTLALTYMNDGQECIIAMIINATILLIRIIIVIVVMVIMTTNANQLKKNATSNHINKQITSHRKCWRTPWGWGTTSSACRGPPS